VGDQINAAVMALAGLNGWEFLRRLVRMSSATPVFSLPQGVAGLTRICVNGRPGSLHGTDYQFLHSGPGDLEGYMKHGFRMLRSADVADIGFSPTLRPVVEPTYLAATAAHVSSGKAQAPVTVTGLTYDGIRVSKRLTVLQGEFGVPPDYSAFYDNRDAVFRSIESVSLDLDADDYISLWGQDVHGHVVLLGHYHPAVKAPRFRQYRINGGLGPYDILAEVRIDPMPMVDDADVLPVPSLEPVKMMMLYAHQVAMNELASAQQYMQQAVQWLQQMQVADNTLQTPVVQNTLFEGSGGSITPSWNL